jgi:D-sedoheptulose 7-phosphate isomerase
LSNTERTRSWLLEAAGVVAAVDPAATAAAVTALATVRERGGTILVCGNGGSASTASHLALDLQKAARPDGRGTRALSLSESVGLVTAWGNDVSFERVFAEQIGVLAAPGDALVVFSVSGSSPNVIAAIETARELSLVTVGFLGRDGGRARALVDHAVVVPSEDYGWVESAHLVLEHVVAYALRNQGATARVRA